MKRTRTRAPLTTLTKIDRVQVVQVMEDLLNVVVSTSEEKNNSQAMYDDKTEVRKLMRYLLDQVVHIKPRRIRKRRIETVSTEVLNQKKPIAGAGPPSVPKTLEEIQRDGWDFNDFVRTQNFNRQTDIKSPGYNPVFQPLRFIVLENPSQLLWQQMFGMTQGPFFSNQSPNCSSLSSLSQVPDNQLQGEPPKKLSRPSEMVRIRNSDLSTLPNDEKPRSQIITAENVVSE
ncbi:unnamed protein product [Caenorhabditis brenneri]